MAERMQDQSQTAVRPPTASSAAAAASASAPTRRNPNTMVRQPPPGQDTANRNSSDLDGDAATQPPPVPSKPKDKKAKKHRDKDRSKDRSKDRDRTKDKGEAELPSLQQTQPPAQPPAQPQIQPPVQPPQPQPRSAAAAPPPVPAPRNHSSQAPSPPQQQQPPPPQPQLPPQPPQSQPQQPRSSSLPRSTLPPRVAQQVAAAAPGGQTGTLSMPQQQQQQSRSFHGTTAAAPAPGPDSPVDNFGPGLVGIINHGNSCYMNAVLQCIGHVDPLAHYFASDLYLHDLFAGTIDKKGRPLPHEYHTELTDSFGQLLKSLWFGTYQPVLSDTLRQIVARTKPDLALREQQDAHEFMTVLLGNLHDELNGYTRLPKVKQKPPLPPAMCADSATFAEDHAQRNRSVIYQLFYGYQRSRFTCPGCAFTTSNTEPITCLSLPIPVGTTRALTIVLADPRGRQTRFGLEVAADGSVRELRRSLATRWQLEQPRQLLLCELGPDGFRRTFRDNESTALLVELGESCGLYAIQLPDPMMDDCDDSDSDDSEPVYRPGGVAPGVRPQEEDLSYIRIVSVHCERTRSGELRRFTGPMHTQVQVHCSHPELKEALIAELEAAGDLPRIANKRDVYVELRLVDGPPQSSVLQQNQRSPPLVGPAVDRALNFNLADGGPRHLKLTVVWGVAERKRYADAFSDEIEPDASLRTAEAQQQQDRPVSLQDCLAQYMAGPPASWMCPNCRRVQHAEQLTRLWACPDLLVIQLKRFQLTGQRKTKVAAFVQFPIESLDLYEYVDEENLGRLNPYSLSATGRPPQSATPADYTFDLVGVVNHSGSLSSGHYTSYALNPSDRQWWRFNDGQVEALADMTAVSSSDAYLLYYQRRTLRTIFVNGAHWSDAIAQQQMYEHQMQIQGPNQPQAPAQPLPFQSLSLTPDAQASAFPTDDQGDGEGVALRRLLRPQANMPINLIPTFAPPPPPPPQQAMISIDDTATGRTVKTGRARIHVPDSKKRQGKWVWRGGVKVWDGPDPPPPADQPATDQAASADPEPPVAE